MAKLGGPTGKLSILTEQSLASDTHSSNINVREMIP
jgi:hypothetical protein